jgi:hypothetical protein
MQLDTKGLEYSIGRDGEQLAGDGLNVLDAENHRRDGVEGDR